MTERTIDEHGQFLLAPEIILESWWSDLAIAAEDVIELYRQYATSEQFHSIFKTDLDLERLPSGKFATNILRFIGQTGLIAPFGPLRNSAKRRRLRTVIQELMYLAGPVDHHRSSIEAAFQSALSAFIAFSFMYSRLVLAS